MRRDAFALADEVARRLREGIEAAVRRLRVGIDEPVPPWDQLVRDLRGQGQEIAVIRAVVDEDDLKAAPSYPLLLVLPHQQSAQIEGVDPAGSIMAQAVRIGVAVHVIAEAPNTRGGEGDLSPLPDLTAAVQATLHGWRPGQPPEEWPEVLRYGQGEWVEIDGGIAEWREEFWTSAWWFGGAGYGC